MPRTSPGPGFGNYTAEEVELAHTWQNYWATFAKTGTMDAPGAPVTWQPYTTAARNTLEFRAASEGGIRVLNNNRDVTCAWWDNYGYKIY
jgi:carboxylesterase type B